MKIAMERIIYKIYCAGIIVIQIDLLRLEWNKIGTLISQRQVTKPMIRERKGDDRDGCIKKGKENELISFLFWKALKKKGNDSRRDSCGKRHL